MATAATMELYEDTPGIVLLRSAPDALHVGSLSLLQPTEGEWLARTAEGVAPVRRGDLLVVRGREPVEVTGSRGKPEALLFHAPPSWVLRAEGLRRRSTQEGDELPRLEPAGGELAKEAGRMLLEGWLRSRRDLGTDDLDETTRHLALLSLARRARTALAEPATCGSRSPARRKGELLRALDALGERPAEDWSIGSFARDLGVSVRHASRLFRHEMGRSFHEYLINLRIERAKKLLANTSLSITDVAMNAGWGSLSHFNSTFRRRVGMTPSAYRDVNWGSR